MSLQLESESFYNKQLLLRADKPYFELILTLSNKVNFQATSNILTNALRKIVVFL